LNASNKLCYSFHKFDSNLINFSDCTTLFRKHQAKNSSIFDIGMGTYFEQMIQILPLVLTVQTSGEKSTQKTGTDSL